MVCLFLEWSCPEPARDVQAQVLHSEENGLHRQAFLLWYRSGREVCDCLKLLHVTVNVFSLTWTENILKTWYLKLVPPILACWHLFPSLVRSIGRKLLGKPLHVTILHISCLKATVTNTETVVKSYTVRHTHRG